MPDEHARKRTCSTVRIASFLFLFFVSAFNIFFGRSNIQLVDNAAHWKNQLRDPSVEKFGKFSIHPEWHLQNRSDRFPSVNDRVKLYMSNWYLPPCKNASIGRFVGNYQIHFQQSDSELWPTAHINDPWDLISNKTMMIDSIIIPDQIMLLDRRAIQDCARSRARIMWPLHTRGKLPSENRVRHRRNMRSYCQDVLDLMNIMGQLDGVTTTNSSTPLIAFFGDRNALRKDKSFELPIIAKYRAAASKQHIAAVLRGALHA